MFWNDPWSGAEPRAQDRSRDDSKDLHGVARPRDAVRVVDRDVPARPVTANGEARACTPRRTRSDHSAADSRDPVPAKVVTFDPQELLRLLASRGGYGDALRRAVTAALTGHRTAPAEHEHDAEQQRLHVGQRVGHLADYLSAGRVSSRLNPQPKPRMNFASSDIRSGVHGGSNVSSSSTSWMPSTWRIALSMSCAISGAAGQPIEVRLYVTFAVDCSTSTS